MQYSSNLSCLWLRTALATSEQGIPENLISDNGPQYASKEFADFADEFEFTHIRLSPRHPQENGLIERDQTVKGILKKAKQSGQSPHKAMLTLRTTPIDAHLPSPAEMLNGRKLKCNLPIRIPNNLPDRGHISQRLREKQVAAKQHFDSKGVRSKSQLEMDQKVYVQDPNKKHWVPGKVTNIVTPRAVEVRVGDKVLRRNTIHVRPDKGYNN